MPGAWNRSEHPKSGAVVILSLLCLRRASEVGMRGLAALWMYVARLMDCILPSRDEATFCG